MDNKSKGLNANTVKMIAIIAMLIDHLTWDYVNTASLAGQLLHVIGRLTAPIMSFFIVEGFFHTRNIKKYVGRMFVFSIISYFAYQYHSYGECFKGYRVSQYYMMLANSVIFSLFLGLLTLVVWFKTSLPKFIKILCVVGCCLLSMTSDWSLIAVLWVFFMGIYHDNFKKQMIALAAVGLFFNGGYILMMALFDVRNWWSSLCQLGIVFAIPILSMYNGKLGKSKRFKWVFYIFYPLHLFILGYLKYYVF